MKTVYDIAYSGLTDRGGLRVEDIQFDRCTFSFCHLGLTTDSSRRSIVKKVGIRDCRSSNHTSVGPAILEDVTVEDLMTVGRLILWDPLLKHVTLRGPCGEIGINGVVDTDVLQSPDIQVPFDREKAAYYESVDWALDIAEAKFISFDIEGVPVRLVRRDPLSQVVVKRCKALGGKWRTKLHPENSYWPKVVDIYLQTEEPEFILVAPKGKSKREFNVLLDGLKNLRDIGLAEPT